MQSHVLRDMETGNSIFLSFFPKESAIVMYWVSQAKWHQVISVRRARPLLYFTLAFREHKERPEAVPVCDSPKLHTLASNFRCGQKMPTGLPGTSRQGSLNWLVLCQLLEL